MKLIILLTCLFISPKPERHFFIGYRIDVNNQSSTGNFQWHTQDGQMPKKRVVYEYVKKQDLLKDFPSFSFDQFNIIGLYEFKSKNECDMFYEYQKNKYLK